MVGSPSPPIDVVPSPPTTVRRPIIIAVTIAIVTVPIHILLQFGVVAPQLTAILLDFSRSLSHFVAQAGDFSGACAALVGPTQSVPVAIIFLAVSS